MSLVACLSGPESKRAAVDIALEDARIPQLPTQGPCPCGCPHVGLNGELIGHHALMDWTSKLPPFASEEHEKQAKKHKRGGEQRFITVHLADADELNRVVAAVEKHGWVLRVHYPEPEPPAKSQALSYLEQLERRIIALEAQSARPPMMGGAMESPGAFNQASSYTAEQTRRAIFSAYARTSANAPGILTGGLLSGTDMQLSAPGSGLSTNISTGEAIVGGSEGGVQGAYYARNASTTNLAISTANPTNPRIDTVCVTIADNGYTEPTGVSGNAAVLQVATGTPTSGATLSNLSGKAALPASSLLLGYVLVPATATNIVSGDIANVASSAQIGLLPAQLRTGAVSLIWSSSASATATITHGAGHTPIWFSLALVLSGQVAYVQATAISSTTISINGQAPGAFSGTGTVYWAVL